VSERYDSITVTVKITDHGRGMNRKELQRLCFRLAKTAKGRSDLRTVNAMTEPSEGPPVMAYWWANGDKKWRTNER
jgi:hypothetical protein